MSGITAHTELRQELDFGEWANALRATAARVGDMTPANRNVGEMLRGSIRRNFQSNGAEGEWAPLSPATLLQRAKGRSGKVQIKTKRGKYTAAAQRVLSGQGIKALILSHALENSITYHAVAEYVDVGTNIIYAAAQFFGIPAPRKWGRATVKALPARNPLKLLPVDEAEIERIYIRFILAGLKG